jgi:hypothetical protein
MTNKELDDLIEWMITEDIDSVFIPHEDYMISIVRLEAS